MIFNWLQRIINVWQQLAERERRLALITMGVVAVMLGFTAYQRATDRLRDLDNTIDRLEDELISYARQIAHRELVESRYATVAAQHSSEWTEAEIHDRLRQEIYRLARRMPPPLDENGIPINMPNEHGNLVEIPGLGRGNMTEGGLGYREYRINLRIPYSPLENIIYFLERLQESPQSLRIDALELSRAPDDDRVMASVDIARIIADGTPSSAATVRIISEGTGRIALQAGAWRSTHAEARDAESAGAHGAVELRAQADNAEAWMTRNLPGGAVYEMIIDIACTDTLLLGIGIEGEPRPFEGIERVAGDGGGYRYHIQFTLPGDSAPKSVRCPWLQFETSDTVAHISNMLLRKVTEV